MNFSSTVGLNPAKEPPNFPKSNTPYSIDKKAITTDPVDMKKLPIFLLGNIQSFGTSAKTDKTTEIESVLELNQVDIGIFTETWLSNSTKDSIKFNGYNMFHLIRENVLRASGGISILVNCDIPANIINLNVPVYLECLWISVRPKWLPRTVSNIVIYGVCFLCTGSLIVSLEQ